MTTSEQRRPTPALSTASGAPGPGTTPPETLAVGAPGNVGFGPSALVTWANAVSIARLVVAPLLFVVVAAKPVAWFSLLLWIALCVTDGIDGWLARRHGVTRSGAFLDPLADKALVLGALVALVVAGVFWWVPVAIIAAREFAISGFRSYWGRRGLAVPATFAAKAKTVLQEVAVSVALFPPLATDRWSSNVLLWAAVGLTVATGYQYLRAGRRVTRVTGGA